MGGDDNLISGRYSQRFERELDRGCARADPDTVFRLAVVGELLLEAREFLAENVLGRRNGGEYRRVDLSLDRSVLQVQIDQRETWLGTCDEDPRSGIDEGVGVYTRRTQGSESVRAGFPTTTLSGSTSCMTTAPAPTRALRPIRIPPPITAPDPSVAPCSTVVERSRQSPST
jgi:hypothetical protein